MFNRRHKTSPDFVPVDSGITESIPPAVDTVKHLGEGAATLTGFERHNHEPVDEGLECGGERLQEMTEKLFAADHPATGTYFRVPADAKRRVFAHTELPRDLPEGAPVEDWSMELPVNAFVEAPGFQDWENGRPDLKNGKSSKRVIGRYACMPGVTAPPIQKVIVYIQPDGKVLCSLVGDGAHRLAAAKKRGDTRIRARDVIFASLERNVL